MNGLDSKLDGSNVGTKVALAYKEGCASVAKVWQFFGQRVETLG